MDSVPPNVSDGMPNDDSSDNGQSTVFVQQFSDISFQDPVLVDQHLAKLGSIGGRADQTESMAELLLQHLPHLPFPDLVVERLAALFAESSDPASMVDSICQGAIDPKAILKLLTMGDHWTNRLVSDPDAIQWLGKRDTNPSFQRLTEELATRLAVLEDHQKAADVFKKFHSRHLLRIAVSELMEELSPDQVGRQLSSLIDALIEAALQYSIGRLSGRRGMPIRTDGTHPTVTVIGLGSLGGMELSYQSPVELIFLFDAIDPRNVWHREFYETLVRELVTLLSGDQGRPDIIDIDLRCGPKHEVGVHICSFPEAARVYETSGRTSQRLDFVKARVVAGSRELGSAFLDRLEPWVYRQFHREAELAEMQATQRRLHRRSEKNVSSVSNFVTDPGGIDDVERIVQSMQLLHGGYISSVRQSNVFDAITALRKEDCLSSQEAANLSERYAMLARLHHQLSLTFDRSDGMLPSEKSKRSRLAWHLGIHDQDSNDGDVQRFDELLAGTLTQNRALIGSLVHDDRIEPSGPTDEFELLLEPVPDAPALISMMRRYGFKDPETAIQQIANLSTETVPFLSHQRCRHVFASLAPQLLAEISQTPSPDASLDMLVKVTDSLGAKAALWDLLQSHQPTLYLVVRMCATTPYLASILIRNPGMIDELVDSLLIDHLPSAEKLDAHSIELCRGVSEINHVLRGFKNSSHLTIGVRDMLGKDPIDATNASIGDTAEACLRRAIEHEQEVIAERLGDPMRPDGEPARVIGLAMGKLGGREPNYHSDLDVLLLYCSDGETKRRIGGHRRTTTNHLFFNQVVRQVVDRINGVGIRSADSSERLYEVDSRLQLSDDEGVLSISFDDFLQRFIDDDVPLWHWMALCKARVFNGSIRQRQFFQDRIGKTLSTFNYSLSVPEKLIQMRSRMQDTASPSNLKRGEGGTVDVEWITQMLTLRYGSVDPVIIRCGTVQSLQAIEKAGFLAGHDASTLIRNYRILRRTEANLRLMNAAGRHELPESDAEMDNLAYLMGEPNAESIRRKCDAARMSNRNLFDQIMKANSAEMA